jgi:hypothetical protein
MLIVDKEIGNFRGNLCLHLIGNLKTFIGIELANRYYQRDREFELSGKEERKERLLSEEKEQRRLY